MFGKTAVKIIFNWLYNFLLIGRLLNRNQSGFRSADSCVNQLLVKHMRYLNRFPVGNCMFKVNNRNTRTRCGICSKLTIKTPERRQ